MILLSSASPTQRLGVLRVELSQNVRHGAPAKAGPTPGQASRAQTYDVGDSPRKTANALGIPESIIIGIYSDSVLTMHAEVAIVVNKRETQYIFGQRCTQITT